MNSVTSKLLRLHRVDSQIRGLRSRIDQAERYLKQQDALLKQIETKREALRGQSRQLEATIGNDENEARSINERIEKLREQLNASKTNKEYSALLTEVSTFKADVAGVEDRVIESMSRLEEIRKSIEALEREHGERSKIREVAKADRDRRAEDVRERLDELERERAVAAAEVPAAALKVFEEEAQSRDEGEEVMAPVEEHSRRHMEYACGACQFILPIESVNRLLGKGELTMCANCRAILFVEEGIREAVASTKR